MWGRPCRRACWDCADLEAALPHPKRAAAATPLPQGEERDAGLGTRLLLSKAPPWSEDPDLAGGAAELGAQLLLGSLPLVVHRHPEIQTSMCDPGGTRRWQGPQDFTLRRGLPAGDPGHGPMQLN